MCYGIIINVLYENEGKIRNVTLRHSYSDFLLLFFLEGIYLYTNEKNTIKYTVKYDKTFNCFWRIPVLEVRDRSLITLQGGGGFRKKWKNKIFTPLQ